MGLENLKVTQNTIKITASHSQPSPFSVIPGKYRTQAQEALSITGQLQPYKAHSHADVSLASATSPVAIPNVKEPNFPRGHLHVIPQSSMFSKNQLKQKQMIRAIKLGDTGMPTQNCQE